MSESVYKIIDMVGSSNVSWEEAAQRPERGPRRLPGGSLEAARATKASERG